MSFFSNLFKKSSFFSSEFTDKSMMSLAEVMHAHANWKSRISKFVDGTLGYNLDPEVLAACDDTELGRWILQADEMEMSAARKNLLGQLHQANEEMHKAASALATHKHAGNAAGVSAANEQFSVAARQVMVLLRELGKEG